MQNMKRIFGFLFVGCLVAVAALNVYAAFLPPSNSEAPVQHPLTPPVIELPAVPAPASKPAPKPLETWKVRRHNEARTAYTVGLIMEEFGKNASPRWMSYPAFTAMRHFGVQLQVAALVDMDQISRNPAVAGMQGFLIGL